MSEQVKLSRLIAGIYDAALEAGRWPEVLAHVVDFVGGHGGCLLAKDAATRDIAARWQTGVEPHYMRLYTETYSKLGPLAALSCGDVGQIVSVADVVPYDEFRRGRFFQEWAQPQGWVDVAVAMIEKTADHCGYLGISRNASNGMVDDEMRRRMALVVPHVRRAVLIGRVIDLKKVQAAAFADALDGISASVFFVDAHARIVHANIAGQTMLDAGDVLRSVDGRLVAIDAEVDEALRDAFIAAAGGDSALGIKGIAIPLRAQDDKPYTAHVLPLTSGERGHAGRTSRAAAALFVRKAALTTPSPPEVIAKSYRLTPTELRVLLAVVDVGGVPEVAEALGVAESTVRSHVARLFEKTGAKRHADLVKLVAGFGSPLAV